MDISITSRRFGATDALQAHTATRLGRALKHFEGVGIGVTMEKAAPNLYVAHATSKGSGTPRHAQASARDMYAAVSGAALKLQRQLSKTKGKVHSKLHDAPETFVAQDS